MSSTEKAALCNSRLILSVAWCDHVSILTFTKDLWMKMNYSCHYLDNVINFVFTQSDHIQRLLLHNICIASWYTTGHQSGLVYYWCFLCLIKWLNQFIVLFHNFSHPKLDSYLIRFPFFPMSENQWLFSRLFCPILTYFFLYDIWHFCQFKKFIFRHLKEWCNILQKFYCSKGRFSIFFSRCLLWASEIFTTKFT